MEIELTFKINAEEGAGLNAVTLCDLLQDHFETQLKNKARVLSYKTKVNDFNAYYLRGECND
tara:strand:- start:169 stop:354 length:186 start_codon:yes stop_codon:yes gene_type:complete